MDLHLSGKTALVSGSSSGIGAAIARTLAAEGVSVVVHGRHEERLHAVASAITREGGKAYVAQGDLSTDEGANETIRATLAALGGAPDILVNNAGGGDEDTLQTWQSSLASWRGLIEHNLFGALRLTLQLLPKLRDKTWGRIINVASGYAYAPGSVMPGYAAAKAAMVNMTVSLAQELAQSGITANTLSPGPVHTPTMELMMRGLAAQHGWGNDWDEIERRVASQAIPTLVGRVGRVEEIAAAVAFLASTHADYMTGSHLRMDGGNIKSIV